MNKLILPFPLPTWNRILAMHPWQRKTLRDWIHYGVWRVVRGLNIPEAERVNYEYLIRPAKKTKKKFKWSMVRREAAFSVESLPVSLHFHSKRYRLADPDGLSAKAVIDGMVKAEIFPDDSVKEISKISHSQEKTIKPEIEETIITIT